MYKSIPLVLAVALGLSACAARYPVKDGVAAEEITEQKEYVTGSMLPQRRSDSAVTKTTKEQTAEMLRKMNSERETLQK